MDPPCFTFPRSSCLSLSLSTRSLSSLPILARVCSHHCQSKDANERDPSSSNNLFPSWSSRNPRHTISYVPWWIPSLLASCESRGIEARTRLSDPDGQVVGPTTSRSRPGRGPTVASGPQQHLWSGLLRGPIWDSSPRSSCNNVDTDPSSFSSFSFSPLFLGLFAPGPRQRILEFKLDASGPNRPDSDTPLILKSSFLPLYGSDLWLSTGIPLQGKLISVQPFFFLCYFRYTSNFRIVGQASDAFSRVGQRMSYCIGSLMKACDPPTLASFLYSHGCSNWITSAFHD